ncbi:hypothetical protein Pcinc_040607 [Petrolisthes cinctipes]|uniref:Uncharacterized protein n=1 Tax=Petrolisthes cinctipes TaxID=88211 RepID=A0AAE1EIH5_PETCI|nr:hypothetical protein Pcinc_040607 [Petrolisthes cinctipes]
MNEVLAVVRPDESMNMNESGFVVEGNSSQSQNDVTPRTLHFSGLSGRRLCKSHKELVALHVIQRPGAKCTEGGHNGSLQRVQDNDQPQVCEGDEEGGVTPRLAKLQEPRATTQPLEFPLL